MTKILITGAAGMVGSHLFETLLDDGHDVIGTFYRPTINMNGLRYRDQLIEVDVRYRPQIERVVESELPDEIYHLAAQSLPVKSWISPEETMDVNVMGTINLFESIKKVRKGNSSYDPVVVVACSSAQYGASLTPLNVPISEDVSFKPLHPYGVSKVAQDLLTLQYWYSEGIRGVRARIFNTTGPRKRGDVVSDFASRCARLKSEGGVEISVGNLEARRAILGVQDLISALRLLANKASPGEAYNICAEELVSISELIECFREVSGVPLIAVQNDSLMRPNDEPIIYGSSVKIKNATGWFPVQSIFSVVSSVYEYELSNVI